MISFKALIDAIINETTYQVVLHERDGLAGLSTRLTLLLHNRGIDTARALFMPMMLADATNKPMANADLLEREIHDAELSRRLTYAGGSSILTAPRRLH